MSAVGSVLYLDGVRVTFDGFKALKTGLPLAWSRPASA